MKKNILLLSGLLLSGSHAFSATWHAAPNGSSNGDGSISRPWDLVSVLSGSKPVKPGDTVWLRGGVYTGKFTSYLQGISTAAITVSSYPGEWARLDSGVSSTNRSAVLRVLGGCTTFRDFEVMSSDTKRVTASAGDEPSDIRRGEGVQVLAPYTRLINLVIHDTAVGVANWSEAPDSEVYGCIIYNNGWQGPKEGGSGHGIYAQNRTGYKVLKDNIVFNQYGKGLQIYGSGSAYVRNFTIEGNVAFNNGIVSSNSVMAQNVVIQGGGGPEGIVMKNNFFYGNKTAGTLQIGGDGAKDLVFQGNYIPHLTRICYWETASITDNTFVEDASMMELYARQNPATLGYTWDRNSYFNEELRYTPFGSYVTGLTGKGLSFTSWKSETGFDRNSQYVKGRAPNKVIVRPNQYEKGRATIIAYNWNNNSSISVNLAGVLNPGQSYEVRNAQNYLAAPVRTGVYDGSSIVLPTTGLLAAAPIGSSAPASSSPEFNVYVVRATSSGGAINIPSTESSAPVNSAPTISTFSNVEIDKNTQTAAIPFTIADAQTSAENLGIIGSSSNPTLVPTTNIRFSGSGSSRSVTVIPAANQLGSCTISVSVTDGSLLSSKSFLLTVKDSVPPNTAPTISAIPDMATYNGDAALPCTFTIGDKETAVSGLSIRATSSNPSLVPTSNIVLGGTGSSRTVTVKPAPGQYGSSTITMIVSDGTLSASRSFVFATALSTANTAPSISPIASITSYNGEQTAPVEFVLNDAEWPESLLVLKADPSDKALVPVSNVIFGGSGAKRTVSVKPAAGQYGSTRIYVLCNDGKKTSIAHFEFNSIKR